VSGCGLTAHNGTVRMVRDAGVPSGSSVVVMGTVGVTTLHPWGTGKMLLPPLAEAVLPSLEDSSRMVCRDGDPL
jgi:hypothetical protein